MSKQKDFAPPSRLPRVLAGTVVTALAILAAAVIYSVSGDDVTARWETSDSTTANPWTPSVVKPGASLSTPGRFVGAATISSVAAGDCDKDALKQHLASDPKLAQNWAQILGINVNDIEPYIDKLQSRRLTVPVQVTNHDYEGDQPRELQSVLDVGTVVLTDIGGTPRVRCTCGNPLKPAVAKATKFENLPLGVDPKTIVTDPATKSKVGTAIRLINRPLIATATGTQTISGYTATDYTSSHSKKTCSIGVHTPYGAAAGLCGGESTAHCWRDQNYAYCQQDARSRELWKVKVEEWRQGNEHDEYRDQPNTVELANGLVCHPTGWRKYDGSQREGMYTRYGCFNSDFDRNENPRPVSRMWGGVKRDGSLWTVRIGEEPEYNAPPPAPLTTVDVRVAYYAIDE